MRVRREDPCAARVSWPDCGGRGWHHAQPLRGLSWGCLLPLLPPKTVDSSATPRLTREYER